MRLMGNLWKALKLVGAARDLAIESRRFRWEAAARTTLYLEAEHADIRLSAHDQREVQARIELQAGFGWQLVTDQDLAGVYIVARRKPLIGTFGRGQFEIVVPADLHLSLKLRDCLLCLDGLSASLDFPKFPSDV
ncbi:MAG: hypothetical protein OXG85_15525 [Chloroflexi bacterium]|nr:hypothetical protein [Chloroflexota bacterium]